VSSLKVKREGILILCPLRLIMISCLNPYLIYNQSRLIVDLPNEFVNESSLKTSERKERGGISNKTSPTELIAKENGARV
jgi:hypothetical protein